MRLMLVVAFVLGLVPAASANPCQQSSPVTPSGEKVWMVGKSRFAVLLANSTVDRAVARGQDGWTWKVPMAVRGSQSVRVTILGTGRFDARGREGSPRSIVLRECRKFRPRMTGYAGAVFFKTLPRSVLFRISAGKARRIVTVTLPRPWQQ